MVKFEHLPFDGIWLNILDFFNSHLWLVDFAILGNIGDCCWRILVELRNWRDWNLKFWLKLWSGGGWLCFGRGLIWHQAERTIGNLLSKTTQSISYSAPCLDQVTHYEATKLWIIGKPNMNLHKSANAVHNTHL